MRSKDLWTFYKDSRGGVRWRLTARNGRTVGAASEAFANLRNAKENARRNGWRPECRTVIQGGLLAK